MKSDTLREKEDEVLHELSNKELNSLIKALERLYSNYDRGMADPIYNALLIRVAKKTAEKFFVPDNDGNEPDLKTVITRATTVMITTICALKVQQMHMEQLSPTTEIQRDAQFMAQLMAYGHSLNMTGADVYKDLMNILDILESEKKDEQQ